MSDRAHARTTFTPKAKEVVVSWYGKQFQGRTMACGGKFDMHDTSIVAHRSLPCGTKVRFTNPDNNKTVVAVVQDHGPKPKGRNFDLSYGAAKKLQIVDEGVAKLLVVIIDS